MSKKRKKKIKARERGKRENGRRKSVLEIHPIGVKHEPNANRRAPQPPLPRLLSQNALTTGPPSVSAIEIFRFFAIFFFVFPPCSRCGLYVIRQRHTHNREIRQSEPDGAADCQQEEVSIKHEPPPHGCSLTVVVVIASSSLWKSLL